MSCYIEPKEVLAYLNELGYQNISAQQLKEFIRDLKKLIKYDHIKKTKENVDPENTQKKTNVCTSLHESRTDASNSKIIKKDKVISVQVKRPTIHQTCKHLEDKNINFEQSAKGNSTTDSTNAIATNNTSEDFDYTEVNIVKERPETSRGQPKVSVKEPSLKPKTSFIRPRLNIKPCKSDPVSLYHYYQAEWKRQKIPGEDNHSTLRWAIRERMLGEPSVLPNIPSRCSNRI